MSLTYACPKGHDSTEADFCSDCGAKIQGDSGSLIAPRSASTSPPPPLSAPSTPSTACPECATPYDENDGDFCDVCGYNFLTGKSGSSFDPGLVMPPAAVMVDPTITIPPLTMPPLTAPPITINPGGVAPTQLRWCITLMIDPTLATADSPPAPTQAPIELPLTEGTNLLGRSSQARGIFPQIAIDFDSAVSQRHALLIVQDNGDLKLRDVGSSNGTYMNGVEIKPMVDTALQDGDEFTLGHWTRARISQLPAP